MAYKFINMKNGKIYEFYCEIDIENMELKLIPLFLIYIGKDENNDFIRLASNKMIRRLTRYRQQYYFYNNREKYLLLV